jgi:hypothetical protein
VAIPRAASHRPVGESRQWRHRSPHPAHDARRPGRAQPP